MKLTRRKFVVGMASGAGLFLSELKPTPAKQGGSASRPKRHFHSHRTLFWRIGSQDAVRQGRWKYYRNGARRWLYDLSVDQRERADFSKQKPDVMERLAAEFDKWNQQMLPRLTGS